MIGNHNQQLQKQTRPKKISAILNPKTLYQGRVKIENWTVKCCCSSKKKEKRKHCRTKMIWGEEDPVSEDLSSWVYLWLIPRLNCKKLAEDEDVETGSEVIHNNLGWEFVLKDLKQGASRWDFHFISGLLIGDNAVLLVINHQCTCIHTIKRSWSSSMNLICKTCQIKFLEFLYKGYKYCRLIPALHDCCRGGMSDVFSLASHPALYRRG